jgi:phosphoserine aminotransferase
VKRVYNFSPGPAALPLAVLEKAQSEMLNWRETGMSVMELPHRGAHFQSVAEQTEADLRELMAIPSNYQVLFLPDGATAQFTMVPLNLLGKRLKADYLELGIWSKKAIGEAKQYGQVNVVASLSRDEQGRLWVPEQSTWRLDPEAAYLHYTPNETIDGVQMHWVPKTDVPLVADMSSIILGMPVDVSQFGVIYASAQKNLGQAGMSVVIIRDDLIQTPLPGTPTLYSYHVHAAHRSVYHTPSTYSWYMLGLVLEWMKQEGGAQVFYERNQRKAKQLYACIDKHADFYLSSVHADYRSIMNVVFHLQDEALTQLFLTEAHEAGLMHLKGHRVRGGIRASIYNAMPEAGVAALVNFMHDFASRHG